MTILQLSVCLVLFKTALWKRKSFETICGYNDCGLGLNLNLDQLGFYILIKKEVQCKYIWNRDKWKCTLYCWMLGRQYICGICQSRWPTAVAITCTAMTPFSPPFVHSLFVVRILPANDCSLAECTFTRQSHRSSLYRLAVMTPQSE